MPREKLLAGMGQTFKDNLWWIGLGTGPGKRWRWLEGVEGALGCSVVLGPRWDVKNFHEKETREGHLVPGTEL